MKYWCKHNVIEYVPLCLKCYNELFIFTGGGMGLVYFLLHDWGDCYYAALLVWCLELECEHLYSGRERGRVVGPCAFVEIECGVQVDRL